MSHLARIAAAATLAAILWMAADPAFAQEAAADARSRITVSGEATVRVAPDIVRLHAGATTDAKTAREAVDANARVMTAVMAAIKAGAIPDKDIKTERYVVHPTYATGASSGGNRISGFRATNALVLTLRNLDSVPDWIDRLTAAGANTARIEFTVSDPSKAMDAARADAIADARRKAEIYARAAGVALGKPITIGEANAGSFSPASVVLARGSFEAPQTPISPGETALRVTVTVSFELH